MFGQLNTGTLPSSADVLSPEDGTLVQSGIFADIQAWMLTRPWVVNCSHDDWSDLAVTNENWSAQSNSDQWNTHITDPIKVEGC